MLAGAAVVLAILVLLYDYGTTGTTSLATFIEAVGNVCQVITT